MLRNITFIDDGYLYTFRDRDQQYWEAYNLDNTFMPEYVYFTKIGLQTFEENEANNIINQKQQRAEEQKKRRKNREGGLLPYINDTHLCLKRYQVIHSSMREKEKTKMMSDNCIIYAIKQVIDDDNLISQIKHKFIKCRYIKQQHIHDIGVEFGLTFTIHNINEDNKQKNANIKKLKKKSEKKPTEPLMLGALSTDSKYDPIELNLYKEHYFIEEKMKITKNHLLNLKNWTKEQYEEHLPKFLTKDYRAGGKPVFLDNGRSREKVFMVKVRKSYKISCKA